MKREIQLDSIELDGPGERLRDGDAGDDLGGASASSRPKLVAGPLRKLDGQQKQYQTCWEGGPPPRWRGVGLQRGAGLATRSAEAVFGGDVDWAVRVVAEGALEMAYSFKMARAWTAVSGDG